MEVNIYTSDKARVADSLDSVFREACGNYCFEISTHPSGKALELAWSDGIIIWALEFVWADGNIVGAQEQESARSDDIIGALESAQSDGIIVGALELAWADDIDTGKAIELSWAEDIGKAFEGDSLDISRSDKAMKVGRAIDNSLEVGGNIGRALYENSFDVGPSGKVQKACDDSMNRGCQ